MKTILVSLACILCLVTFGWAAWTGTVFKDGSPQKDAVVRAYAPGYGYEGYCSTGTGGGYILQLTNGRYYEYIKATYGSYYGKNYVEDYYYDNQSIHGLDINLSLQGADPP